ncbi:VOC family protein [Pseudogemmobacter bohemicus]|uniref:VOC family protein n=1 Tax=Pseudogemmobacter bohemicus TaxID=2250708 RepID=UPI000DD3655D|nr:VOC family protein [Pseudogemmobacter bohemicus]
MAINRIDHAAIYVSDLEKALTWYRDVLSLNVLSQDKKRIHLACRDDAADLTLVLGNRSVDNFTFGVDDEEDLTRVARILTDEGVAHERHSGDSRPGEGAALCFALPSGHRMRLATGTKTRRAGISDFASDGSHAPGDMDHINLLGEVSPVVMRDFLVKIGFKSSLNISVNGEPGGVWLRGSDYDHDIAYMRGVNPKDRLHHVAFAAEDGNHYFRLSDRLMDTGHRWEFGPGRHNAGLGKSTGFGTNNYAYAFDPFGNRNEFSSGMEQFAPDTPPLYTDIRPEQMPDVMNGWGYEMAETFMTTGS